MRFCTVEGSERACSICASVISARSGRLTSSSRSFSYRSRSRIKSESRRARLSRLSAGGQFPFAFDKTLPCHFPLALHLILRGFDALQIIGIVVFFFRVEVAVSLDQLPQTLFHLRPAQGNCLIAVAFGQG